jgi:hypothetical protein
MRIHHAIGLAALAAAFSISPAGRAQKKDASAQELALAKDMLKDAIAEEKAGKCADALSMLKQVLAIKETGEALMHMGDCQAKLGDTAEALKTYEHAEDVARADKDKATQQALVAKLGDLRDRIPTISIRLPEDSKDAKVKVDGEVIDPAALSKPIVVPTGEHSIEVTQDGRRTFTKKVTVAEKDHEEIKVELPSEGGETPSTPPETPAQPDKGATPEIPLATWIAGSTAIILAAGGVVAFVLAGSKASDGEAQCAQQTSQSACDAGAKDTVHTLDAAALGMWIGAGIGAGIAVTFFVLSRDAGEKAHHGPPGTSFLRSPPPPPTARVVVGPGSLRLVGTF